MENKIIKNSTTQIISFDSYKPKITDANKLILEFLKSSYENKKIICKNDIYNIYCFWKFGEGKMTNKRKYTYDYYDQIFYHDTSTGEKRTKKVYGKIYSNEIMTKEEYINSFGNKTKSIGWFKNNLGAVILKGKLVVLPVIEI